MSFRFWRRIKIAPGLTLNLSKSGGSFSVGPRGAKFTVGSRGKRATMGIPGTGLFYTEVLSGSARGRRKTASSPSSGTSMIDAKDRLTLGFFKRLVTPDVEEALVDGCRELALGDEGKALAFLNNAGHLADGAYLAGFLSLKRRQLAAAKTHLITAAENYQRLGHYFAKYGISATMSLPITDEVSAYVEADLRGVLLGLVEVYQQQECWRDAIECLKRLRRLEPQDVVVKLSLAELLLAVGHGEKSDCQKVVRLAEGIQNETPVHAALMLYKGKALRHLGLATAARDVLTTALRRQKNRPDDLLRAVRYERALAYEDLGQKSRVRAEFEKLYADAPDYADVAQRLGL